MFYFLADSHKENRIFMQKPHERRISIRFQSVITPTKPDWSNHGRKHASF